MLLTVFFLMLFFVPSPTAQTYPDSLTRCWLQRVQDLLFDNAFDSAEAVAATMTHDRPDDPGGYICGAVTVLARSLDGEEGYRSGLFKVCLDSAEYLAKNRLGQCPDQEAAWMELYRGLAKSYRSLWEARFGSAITAIRTGYQAKGHFEAGWERDSTCFDLLFGLGLFHYWKSVKAGLLRSLGLFSDDTELGIEQLRIAADSALVFDQAAHNALIWVWIDRQQYDSAIALCRDMMTKYPRGTTFYWPLARAIYESGSITTAVGIYKNLRRSLAAEPGNYYNLIECDFLLARCYQDKDDKEKFRLAARTACEYLGLVPPDVSRRQRDKIDFLRRAARI